MLSELALALDADESERENDDLLELDSEFDTLDKLLELADDELADDELEKLTLTLDLEDDDLLLADIDDALLELLLLLALDELLDELELDDDTLELEYDDDQLDSETEIELRLLLEHSSPQHTYVYQRSTT